MADWEMGAATALIPASCDSLATIHEAPALRATHLQNCNPSGRYFSASDLIRSKVVLADC